MPKIEAQPLKRNKGRSKLVKEIDNINCYTVAGTGMRNMGINHVDIIQ